MASQKKGAVSQRLLFSYRIVGCDSDHRYSVTLKKWIFYGKLWQKCILRPNLLLLDTMNENVGTWDFYIALTDLFQKIPA